MRISVKRTAARDAAEGGAIVAVVGAADVATAMGRFSTDSLSEI
jgi:hypothetical protein